MGKSKNNKAKKQDKKNDGSGVVADMRNTDDFLEAFSAFNEFEAGNSDQGDAYENDGGYSAVRSPDTGGQWDHRQSRGRARVNRKQDGWDSVNDAAAPSGWDAGAMPNWAADDGWGTSSNNNKDMLGTWDQGGWPAQPGIGWGDDTRQVSEGWSNHEAGKSKRKKNKGKDTTQGSWGYGFDQQQMERHHQDLLQQMAKAAPPPKGVEYGPLPSRTLKIARTDEPDLLAMQHEVSHTGEGFVRFIDSGGSALKPAEKALYGRNRLARDRFHWLFPPTKDVRVFDLLNWIQHMSYGLASLGLSKFLETGERGALITNVEYRATKSPSEPAFDYLTWPAANETFDRTLQQSLAYYDPETQVLVFVFLLSRSQNSMAIWRRKLTVPVILRTQYGEAIKKKKAEFSQRKIVIRIDDYDSTNNGNLHEGSSMQQPHAPKKKWFRWAS